jgi:photosystem II stability/assembly factor-like uncharacterized protein
MRRAAAIFLVLLSAAPVVRGQWNVTTPKLVKMPGVEIAAIAYKGGNAWTGSFTLYESRDSGATWRANAAFPMQKDDYILDIALFDTNHILVICRFGIYSSTNGGQSWRILIDINDMQDGASGVYCGSADTMVLMDFDGVAWRSTNAGATWTQTKLNSVAQKIGYHNGAEYTVTGVGQVPALPFSGGLTYKSSDGGATWKAQSGTLDQDSYGMTFDSCRGAMYATNEAYDNGLDTASQILLSTDEGASWQVSNMNDRLYFAGTLTTGKQCVFASTTSGGVERLTGTKWERINGPNLMRDTRSLCAIDDNIILAINEQGDIVRTLNSGGVPLPGGYVPPVASPMSLFNNAVLIPCEQRIEAVQITPYGGASCFPPSIISQRIEGIDASAFTIVHTAETSLTKRDSVVVSFQPSAPARTYTGTLIIDLSDGTTWRIALQASGIDSTATRIIISDVKTDTLGDLEIPIRGRIPRVLIAKMQYDTSSLVFVSATDPFGNSIITGDTLHFSNVAGISNDTLLGVLRFEFYPTDQRCASISIDSVRFVSDAILCGAQSGSKASICYNGACGSSLLSGLMRNNTAPDFQIVPNPAKTEATITSTHNEEVSVSLFDAAGVLRKSATGKRIDLSDLPEGVYVARVQSGEYQAAIRLVHVVN